MLESVREIHGHTSGSHSAATEREINEKWRWFLSGKVLLFILKTVHRV